MQVSLSGNLSVLVGGQTSLDIHAETIAELFERLVDRYPAFQPHLKQEEIAVAINGEIYRDEWNTPIPADAEVFLIPRIQGG